MHISLLKSFALVISFIILSVSMTACSTFFDKDNTPTPSPLVNFTPQIKPTYQWSKSVGGNKDSDYLKIGPAVNATAIYTANSSGIVTSLDKSGNQLWRMSTKLPFSTSPGIGDDIVVVGSRKGEVIALEQSTGKERWRKTLSGEILATPAIKNGTVIIKAVNGYVWALSATTGAERWSFQQVEPNLVLRGASAPIIQENHVLVGFANGNLAKLNMADGQLSWMQAVATPTGAFSIQRMIDVDADPIVYEHRIYAATYQGKITAMDWVLGKFLWSHDISSYTGMVADRNMVYITDAQGNVWAFNAYTGAVNWRQQKLSARILTGPVLMGNYVVVGDAQGYLHWLDKRDGHFVARESIGSAMYAAPVVQDNELFALTNSGKLAAYTN